MSDIMGTRAEAEALLLAAWRAWTPLVQPLVAPAKIHRRREAEERQARQVLVQAAAVLAWHLDREVQAS